MKLKRYRGHLSDKQHAVINDLFQNGLTEPEAIEKHNISPRRYRKWLEKGLFSQEINDRFEAAVRQSKLVMARWLPLTAERLAQLTISEKDETARKACLDIISLHTPETEQKTVEDIKPKELPPEVASRLLAALVEIEKNPEPQASTLGLEIQKNPWKSVLIRG